MAEGEGRGRLIGQVLGAALVAAISALATGGVVSQGKQALAEENTDLMRVVEYLGSRHDHELERLDGLLVEAKESARRCWRSRNGEAEIPEAELRRIVPDAPPVSAAPPANAPVVSSETYEKLGPQVQQALPEPTP